MMMRWVTTITDIITSSWQRSVMERKQNVDRTDLKRWWSNGYKNWDAKEFKGTAE